MAHSLALVGYFLGADVCYITTTNNTPLPTELHTIYVKSSKEMQDVLIDSIREAKKGVLTKTSLQTDKKLIQKKPIFISSSAVSDYTPKYPQNGKLKKDLIGDEWSLVLKKNIDILSSLKEDNSIFKIGFKAEFDKDLALNSAKDMLKNKALHGVCLNVLGEDINFGDDESRINLILKDKIIDFHKDKKLNIALKIILSLKELEGKSETHSNYYGR
jgi:phosphopantothenoylcysteine decarboxylase/phosphopantothenate--cysteine ligase